MPVAEPTILPSIGMRGHYALLAPFGTLQLGNTLYTCQAIRSISDYISQGEDPYNTIYVANALTDADYLRDKAANQPIVSLQGETGQWIILPSNYIARYPDANGVPYVTLMLGVNLGALPTDFSMEAISESIRNVVYDQLGVIPTIVPTILSKVTLVPREDHDAIVTARQSRATQVLSDSAKHRAVQIQLDSALNKIAELEAYILAHLLPAK